MQIPKSDIEKIKLITVAAQVNDLIALLQNIDKENLIAAIRFVSPKDRATSMYKFLIHALDFYNNVEKELMKEENKERENAGQFAFEF